MPILKKKSHNCAVAAIRHYPHSLKDDWAHLFDTKSFTVDSLLIVRAHAIKKTTAETVLPTVVLLSTDVNVRQRFLCNLLEYELELEIDIVHATLEGELASFWALLELSRGVAGEQRDGLRLVVP